MPFSVPSFDSSSSLSIRYALRRKGEKIAVSFRKKHLRNVFDRVGETYGKCAKYNNSDCVRVKNAAMTFVTFNKLRVNSSAHSDGGLNSLY